MKEFIPIPKKKLKQYRTIEDFRTDLENGLSNFELVNFGGKTRPSWWLMVYDEADKAFAKMFLS